MGGIAHAVGLLLALILGLLLAAAWFDLRTRRVPFVLMHGVLAAGLTMGALHAHWLAVGAAALAAFVSSLPVRRNLRIAVASASGLATVLLARHSADAVAALIAIFVAWLLWEFHLWGGADATIALSLLAMFPTNNFLGLLVIVLAAGSLLMLVVRHRAQVLVALGATWLSLRAGQPPTRARLETRGMPATWMLALAALLHVTAGAGWSP